MIIYIHAAYIYTYIYFSFYTTWCWICFFISQFRISFVLLKCIYWPEKLAFRYPFRYTYSLWLRYCLVCLRHVTWKKIDCSRQQYGISFCAMILRYIFIAPYTILSIDFIFPTSSERLFWIRQEAFQYIKQEDFRAEAATAPLVCTVALDLRSQWNNQRYAPSNVKFLLSKFSLVKYFLV